MINKKHYAACFLSVVISGFSCAIQAADTVSITGAANSDWEVAYCYVFTINNNTNTDISNWTLHFVLQGSQINQTWEAEYSHNNTNYTAIPVDWNQKIPVQKQAYASFCADGSQKPAQISLDYTTATGRYTVAASSGNTDNSTNTGNTNTGNTDTGNTNNTPPTVTIPLAKANAAGIIFQTSFETDQWMNLLPRGNIGSLGKTYTQYFTDTWRDGTQYLTGKNGLAWENRAGSHLPYGYEYALGEQQGPLYLRYYRKYDNGFEFKTEAKGHGIFARHNYQRLGAGIRPQGNDEFSCRVQIMQEGWYDNASRKPINWGDVHQGEPVLYCYHLDQITQYGDKFRQNVGAIKLIKAGEWHSYEMLVKANDAGQKNGEVKLWIDGKLKLQRTGIEFRKTNDLNFNILEFSAWAGGTVSAPRDQILFDDNLVLSKKRIGPAKAKEIKDYPLR